MRPISPQDSIEAQLTPSEAAAWARLQAAAPESAEQAAARDAWLALGVELTLHRAFADDAHQIPIAAFVTVRRAPPPDRGIETG
jgi:hypothetical protein